MLLPFQGVSSFNVSTQGDALGLLLLPLWGVFDYLQKLKSV